MRATSFRVPIDLFIGLSAELARFASPSLKVEMRDDERVRVGKMPGEIGLQTGKLWLADQSLRDESLAQVL